MYGGPGPASATDTLFTNAGGTTYESFGYEVSFNSTSDARVNALTAPNVFTFNTARVNTPTWVRDRLYTFTESYSGDTTKKLNIAVTDTVTGTVYTIPEYTVTYGNVQSLIVRMVAPDPDLTGSTPRPTAGSLSFTNWQVSGTPVAGMPSTLTLSTSDTPGVDDIRLINYFKITGLDFTQAWTLSGGFTMTWSGSTNIFSNPNPLPGNNDLAFQVKAYQLNLTETPEPGTFVLFGSALLIGALHFRRRPRGS
jgi:hypothetical protein